MRDDSRSIPRSATVRIVPVTPALLAEFPMLAVDRPHWAAIKFVGDTPTQVFQGLTCRGSDGSLIHFQSRVRRACGRGAVYGGVVTDPPADRCPWDDDADCPQRFDHERMVAASETTWRRAAA